MNRNRELGRRGDRQSSTVDNKDPMWWAIWRLGVLPKLCHFIWRGCRNILVIQNNLIRMGIRLETCCPLCDEEKWLCRKYDEVKDMEQFMRWVVCGLWQIWKCLNSAVFEKVIPTSMGVLELLSQHVREISVEGEMQVRWVKPHFCPIKFDGGSRSIAIGIDGLCGTRVLVDMINGVLAPEAALERYFMGYEPYSTTIEFSRVFIYSLCL
ncbi:hypothetical protein D8674_009456 [Pyrus ussuriensis x Pyrus communis]|uniref:Reverse transcriptase zinc-binding domain-containing protein n=1 Tax=Pyrus ussuriensis x Pyrus communis TaxID=2448454 RepID=A0A5N5F820_9ROSA|nr:hypothetical protein D8674_009456 [Pyrus ussuriensis x Pyrus communis]